MFNINKLTQEIITNSVNSGVEVIIKKDKDGDLVFDLNVRAKSWLYIKNLDDGSVNCYGRYDYVANIDSWEELIYEVRGCLHGRDYINDAWLKILVDNKAVKIEIKKETKLKF